jgi:hypothetical protein
MLKIKTYKIKMLYRPIEPRKFIEIDENYNILCRMPKTSMILFYKISYNKVYKRNMHRATNMFHYMGTRLLPPVHQITINKRNLPNQGYTYYKPSSTMKGNDPIKKHNIYDANIVTSTGQPLPLHEISHFSIIDKETGLAVGVLTSSQDPKKGNIFVAFENYQGDKLPPKSDGDIKNKPQFVRLYDNPRYVQECNNKEYNSKVQTFLDKYANEIDKILAIHKNKNQIPVVRFDKDSSQFYHENGLPIFDKNGKEIDYD